MMSKLEFCAGLCAVLSAACVGTARAENTATIADGVLTITLTKGCNLSEVASAEQLDAMRAGTVTEVVKNGAFAFTNDVASLAGYTGPWTINAGSFTCLDPAGLGAGVVTQKTTEVRFRKNATWTNAVVFTANSDCTFFMPLGGQMDGDLTSAANLKVNASAVVTLNGRISAPGKYVYPISSNNSQMNFKGAITAAHFGLSGNDTACRPNVMVYSSDNAVKRFNSTYGNMYLEGVNCMTNATLSLGYTEKNGDTNLRAAFWFDKDQMFYGFVDCTTASHTGSLSYHTSWICNNSRLTINGDADTATDMRFCGNGSIAWNPPTRRTITFHNNRNHPLSGGLIVSNGVFTVSSTTAFPSVTSIEAGPGAFFDFNSTGSLAAMKTITAASCATVNVSQTSASFVTDRITFDLATDAVVDLGARDGILLAKAFKVNGEHLAGGYYTGADGVAGATKIPQLKGTCVIQVPEYEAPTESATWDGGAGADETRVSVAANWAGDTLPDFTSTGAWPTFATGGTRATVDQAIALKSMTFSGGNAFTVDATGDGAVSLYQGGLRFLGDDTTARTNEVAVPIIQRAGAAWMVEGSKTLARLRAPVSSVGSLTTVKGGAGTLAIYSTNDFTGAFTITSGTVNVYSKKNPFGTGEGVLRLNAATSPYPKLFFQRGVEMDKTCVFDLKSNENPSPRFSLANGEWNQYVTNVFHRPVTFNGSPLYVPMGNYNVTVFEDAFTAGGYLAMIGNPYTHIHFKGHVDVNNWSAQGNSHAYLYRPDNATPTWNIRIGCSVTCMTNDVFSQCSNLSVEGKNSDPTYSTWYLNGFDQRVPSLTVYDGGRVINAGAPMRLTLTGPGRFALGTQLTGPIDFTLDASGKTFAVSNVVAATGTIEVKAGTFRFGTTNTWFGATNVVVSGGTLKLPNVAAFDRHATLTVGAAATVDLPAGVEQRVETLTFADGAARVGTWGAAGAVDAQGKPVQHTSDRFTGTGCLRVGQVGTIMVFR